MSSAVIFQLQSVCIFLLLLLGVFYRRKRTLHLKIMSSAIAWDFLLILQIELTRSAIIKASKFIENTYWLNIHVALAVTTVVFYLVMIYLGRKIIKTNDVHVRKKHRIAGVVTIILRALTLTTSFLINMK